MFVDAADQALLINNSANEICGKNILYKQQLKGQKLNWIESVLKQSNLHENNLGLAEKEIVGKGRGFIATTSFEQGSFICEYALQVN